MGDDVAAGTKERRAPLQNGGRVLLMEEKEPAVGRVEGTEAPQLFDRLHIDVLVNEADVLPSGPVEDGAGAPQGSLVHIDAHDRTLCSNQVGQLEETAEGPAANVHHLVV